MKIDVKLWLSRAQECVSLQSSKVGSARRETLNLLQGTFFSDPFSKESEASELNFVYEYTKVKVGSIYARNPHIFVRARSNKYSPFAETMETVVNYYWRELKLKQKIKKAILDAILMPPGWISVGFIGDLVKSERENGIFDDTVKNADVFAEHVSSWDIVWPDGYHNIQEAPYLIEVEKTPLRDVLSNNMYKKSVFNLPNAKLPGTIKNPSLATMKSNPPMFKPGTGEAEQNEIITLYHIWDKRNSKRFTIAANYDKDTIFERDWDYLIEGYPKRELIFNEIPKSDSDANSYPMSDIIPMLPQLRDLSMINTAILKHGKRAGTVILAAKGQLSDEEVTNIQNAGDVDLIFLESIDEGRIRNFSTPSLPSDWYKIRGLILEDLMRISGFQQLLAQSKGIETATESSNLKEGELIRTNESVDQIEDFTIEIAKLLAGLCWQFLDNERISGIIGEEVDERMWPDLPEDRNEAKIIIQREVEFRIDAGSTRPPKDEAVERKQWIDTVAMLKATFPNRIKDDKLLEQFLKKIDFKDVKDLIIGFDDIETQVAQEENKLLSQGVRQLISPNENHMLHLQVHAQAAQTPGLPPTKELDEHILKHSQYLELQMPKANPQRGDKKAPASTTMPDLLRGGVPSKSNLVGGATNVNKGTGA